MNIKETMSKFFASKFGGTLTMYNAIVFFFAIHIAMVVILGFQQTSAELITSFLFPEQWSELPLIQFFSSTFGLAVAGGLIVTTTAFFRSEFPIYAGVAVAFFTYIPLYVEFYQQVQSKGILGPTTSSIFVSIFFGVIIFAWIMILLEFMRGRS